MDYLLFMFIFLAVSILVYGAVQQRADAARAERTKADGASREALLAESVAQARNRSATRTRRALGFIYYSERAREDAEAHTAYQHQLAEDMKSRGKI